MHIASYVHVYSVIIEVTIGQSLQDDTKHTQGQQGAADADSKQCYSLCINTIARQITTKQTPIYGIIRLALVHKY